MAAVRYVSPAGFGHVLRGREHVHDPRAGREPRLVGRDGRSSAPFYAASLFAPEPRFRLPAATLELAGSRLARHDCERSGRRSGKSRASVRFRGSDHAPLDARPARVIPAVRGRPDAASPRRSGQVASAALPGHPRLLRRLRPHLPRRRAAHPDRPSAARCRQEARPDALGLYCAGEEGVRVRRPEGLLLHPAGSSRSSSATLPPDDQATTPALFLAGKGDIAAISPRPTPTPAAPGPVAPEADAAAAGAGIRVPGRRGRPGDPSDPGADHARPAGGRSTLTFTNLKENQGISDKEFAFRIPRGVDVITDGTRN